MVIWTLLEGGIEATVIAALFTTIIVSGHLFNRVLCGRNLSTSFWLILSAIMGVAAGMGCGLIILLFMALKTGLHAHGPEFSAADINWVLQQFPLWALVGLLSGLGLGFLLKAAES